MPFSTRPVQRRFTFKARWRSTRSFTSGTYSFDGSPSPVIGFDGHYTQLIDDSLSLTPSGGQINVEDGASVAITCPISGNAVLTKSGAGTLILSGTNTYTDGTIVEDGLLVLGSVHALGGSISQSQPSAGPLTIDSGTTLDLNGYDTMVNGLSGCGSVTSNASPVATNKTATRLIVGTALGTQCGTAYNLQSTVSYQASTFSGVICDGTNSADKVALEVAAGTLTLSGENTYTGGTTIDGASRLSGVRSRLPGGQPPQQPSELTVAMLSHSMAR